MDTIIINLACLNYSLHSFNTNVLCKIILLLTFFSIYTSKHTISFTHVKEQATTKIMHCWTSFYLLEVCFFLKAREYNYGLEARQKTKHRYL